MKTFKVEIPEGYEIDRENSSLEKIVFKKKGLSYEDVAEKLFYGKESFYANSDGEAGVIKKTDASTYCPNTSSTKEQVESIMALNKLCNVAKYLNGKWVPDWNNNASQKWKYTIRYGVIEITRAFYSKSTSVYFKSREDAEKAIEILGKEEIIKTLTLNH